MNGRTGSFRILATSAALALLGACSGSIGDDMSGGEPIGGSMGGKTGSNQGGGGNTGSNTGGSTGFPTTNAAPVSTRIWRLTRAQYNNTVADLIGDTSKAADAFEPESSSTGFLNDESSMKVTNKFMEDASKAATKLAGDALSQRLATVFPDGEAKLADNAAVRAWVGKFGRRAFRRPLTSAEIDAYTGIYTGAKAKMLDPKTSVQLVLEAFLQSPHFLFRSELGSGKADAKGRVTLTPHEVATSLSFYLTNSTPDAELDAAADSGAIMDRAELEKHAKRLLGSERAKTVVLGFFTEMMGLPGLADLDAKIGPNAKDFTAAKPVLAKETETFLSELIFKGDASFKTLLTANYSYVDANVAKLYGVPAPSTAWGKVTVDKDGKDRAGILTQPSIMGLFAHEGQSSPILRGKFVAERLLCRELPDPLEGVSSMTPPPTAGKTTRELYAALTETPGTACAACHKSLNGPGYLMEHIDWVGKVRRDEAGVPINTVAEVFGAEDADGKYNNVGEFAAKLAGSKIARDCMTRQLFRYAAGKKEVMTEDGPALAEMLGGFEKSDLNLKDLLLTHVLSERFVTRKAN